MALDLLTIAGVAGSALIVFAYFANQQEWLRAENWPYSLANLVGAVLILVSLITAWNLAAAIWCSLPKAKKMAVLWGALGRAKCEERSSA
jgi:hypothetical protein